MSVKRKVEVGCDLCKWPAKTFGSETEAISKGWLKVGQEEYHTERAFFDTWLCPSCVKKVRASKA